MLKKSGFIALALIATQISSLAMADINLDQAQKAGVEAKSSTDQFFQNEFTRSINSKQIGAQLPIILHRRTQFWVYRR